MAATTKRVLKRTPLFMNLAFSSFHDSLQGSPTSKKCEDLLNKARSAGVSKIAFLRHGKTAPKPEKGVDFDRLLTDEGREQARSAGKSFGLHLKPFFPTFLVSPAPRTVETAELFLEAADATTSVNLTKVQILYDGTMQPEGSKLFQKIGYAPLKDYLDSDDLNDKAAARSVLGAYAHAVAETVLDTVEQLDCNKQGTTLFIVGHAIYLPAAALGIASLVNCDDASKDVILSTNTREAEGYLISLDESTAKYLSRE